jgi:hypothetical protein
MVSSFVTEGGSGAVKGPRRCLWPRFRRAVPAAPGVGRTRHPRLGAAERRAALVVNVLTWRELANFERWRLTSGALR